MIDDDAVSASLQGQKQKLDNIAKKAVGEKAVTTTKKRFLTAQERLKGQSILATWVATGVILAAVIGGFAFFFPLTYGWPGLNVQQVNARKWLGYDLHFAK